MSQHLWGLRWKEITRRNSKLSFVYGASLRQIVVQATNPNGRSIQVAVLTDDTQRAASEILRLMFCRWVQENDFKYLDKHFGINQITSYGVVGYEELREQVEDRQVRSAEVKALGEQRRQLRARQGASTKPHCARHA
jgi:hypothetical protein